MSLKPEEILAGPHFKAVGFGHSDGWGEFQYEHPRRGTVSGKVFLRQYLDFSAMEVSLGQLPPGVSMPFTHAHKQNEELYLVLSGQGEMQVDGQQIPLFPGAAVRVDPAGMRCWRNTGTEPMSYLVVQAKAGSLEQATAGDGILSDQPVVWK